MYAILRLVGTAQVRYFSGRLEPNMATVAVLAQARSVFNLFTFHIVHRFLALSNRCLVDCPPVHLIVTGLELGFPLAPVD